jgi:hypothetical protein
MSQAPATTSPSADRGKAADDIYVRAIYLETKSSFTVDGQCPICAITKTAKTIELHTADGKGVIIYLCRKHQLQTATKGARKIAPSNK